MFKSDDMKIFVVPEQLQWWHLLIIAGTFALVPVFRAVAVILVAKCIKPDLAKLAIPFILCHSRVSIFSWGRTFKPAIKAQTEESVRIE
jgi:hypothetical protein